MRLRGDQLGKKRGGTWSLFKKYAAIGLLLAVAVLLIRFPDAMCFLCDYGDGKAPSSRSGDIFYLLLLLAPFIAGLTAIRLSWVIPIGMAVTHLATQHLAGNSWEDAANNESALSILELFFGLGSLGLGYLVRLFAHFVFVRRTRRTAIMDH